MAAMRASPLRVREDDGSETLVRIHPHNGGDDSFTFTLLHNAKKLKIATVANRLPSSSASFGIQEAATFLVTVNLGLNRGFRVRIPVGSPSSFPQEDSTFGVFHFNFQSSIPHPPNAAPANNFSRESVRSLLFELFPSQTDNITPLPLLPAIDCATGPKPLAPEHLMGPPITQFTLSQGPALQQSAPFIQRLPSKSFHLPSFRGCHPKVSTSQRLPHAHILCTYSFRTTMLFQGIRPSLTR
jgi:hypothetical protein